MGADCLQRKFLFFPVLRRGSVERQDQHILDRVSILPRLATGIGRLKSIDPIVQFLFFPVLRRGSLQFAHFLWSLRFYSSPSCDGDLTARIIRKLPEVSILPRLATGIPVGCASMSRYTVSILPRLATGINRLLKRSIQVNSFYSSPSCDGDQEGKSVAVRGKVSILPRLATGIHCKSLLCDIPCFYSSPSCDGDLSLSVLLSILLCFYSSPSCDGDPTNSTTSQNVGVSILPRLATGILFRAS